MIEKDIEQFLVKKIKNLGGLTYKFVSPSNRGVPDRIVIFKGKVYFVELKKPGEAPRPDQIYIHGQFSKQGVPVQVISSKTQVLAFVNRIGRESDRV